ncbi:glycoside hydrolase family 88 protein [Crepidotus variabilis]|uniref:Glycoside hydrolase family 88 protein n=1 Tax=Crepidotus variabilis TaxID=179855 RepID=A0A9P6EQT1_9AGAR|nr:glycoside hydrolase family 88 protein [Crepidotus variabilis]
MRAVSCGAAVLLLLQSASAAFPGDLFSPLIAQKVLHTYQSLPSLNQYPHVTDSTQGKWKYMPSDWWTAGFFPATLYLMNTRKTQCGASNEQAMADWLNLGRSASSALLGVTDAGDVGHDVGFVSFAFSEELKVNPQNHTAIDAVNRFATMLAARFDPAVGCTRSWNPKPNQDSTTFEVIMDNMMNLELLFHSADLTGDNHLREIAMSHADKTMENHIRPDGSSFHVVVYNAVTGAVIRKRTAQGYSDSSTWARGQAWGIYGFSNMYRLTQKPAYLDTARKMANWFIDHLPSDGIVPWDFNAPVPTYADTSAAMVTVNGLLMLADVETDPVQKGRWIDTSFSLMNKTTTFAWRPDWESLLSNGTANVPLGSFNTGIVYGDHYFIRATNEMFRMGLTPCPGAPLAAAQTKPSSQTTNVQPNTNTKTSSARRIQPFRLW